MAAKKKAPPRVAEMRTYEAHPIADAWPMFTDEEHAALVEDIKSRGLLQPIVLFEGLILDGRNRAKACIEAGVEIRTVEYTGDDPIGYAFALNEQRRHLSASQRAMVAANLANLRVGEVGNGRSADLHSYSLADAAEMMDVSRRSVATAKAVERASPELADAVRAGDLSLNAASEIAKDPEAMEMVETEGVAEVIERRAHVAHNSGNNEWYTPGRFIEAAREVMGDIDTDPASSPVANETVGARRFYTAEDDGLSREWFGCVWMNPPYAQPLIGQFIEKLHGEVKARRVNQAIVLVNNGTETKWGQRLLDLASAVCLPAGRIRFMGPDGKEGASPLQGQMVVYVGDQSQRFAACFGGFGWVVEAA